MFAAYAGGVAVFSGPGNDRSWGIWASFGYAAAALLAGAWPTRRGRLAALAAGLAGALAAPVVWLATQAPATPDVAVVTRSAALLLHHGSPYLPVAQLAHGGFLGYNPYLPVMAACGLARASGLPGLAGDPRPWLAMATFLLLAAAFRIASGDRARTGRSLRLAAFAVASPVLAFPLAEGITDPPVLALTCLALALLASPTRSAVRPGAWLAPGPWAAAVTIAVACAMKYTAWPAVVVLTAMLATRDGARTAATFAAAAVGAAAALTVVLAPAAIAAPASLIQNTLAYPLGLTRVRTPAQSPLPGHLLATLGPAGHLAAIVLLIAAGLGIAVSLVTRPPADGAAAARRLALGLALVFALSPATRFGYFAYPAGLYGWLALTGQADGTGRLIPAIRMAADSVRSVAIETRPLGRTGADVTILGYGAMELRGQPRGPAITDDEAGRLLNAVLDSGINLIDTSVDYGRSEELIGRYVGHRRDEYFLASKCGCLLSPPPDATPPYPHDYSAANVRADVEQSLRRLRTDRLDLVQVHMSPSRALMEAEQTVETMQAIRAEGKIRFIGMSGILPNLRDHIAMGVFDVFQIPYSAVQREHEDLITAAADTGAGTLIRGGAARGAPAEDKAWRSGPLGLDQGVGQRRWETSGVGGLLDGMSPIEFVLRFTLSHPALSSTIVGTSSVDHLRSNVAMAGNGPLPPDLYEEAKRRLEPAST